ncbi:ABC transporter permease [Kineosporia sp. R_H_3]|uniref:ABC transporter permease n=1 Tax=Kineosporia sp. R_H_3 TaxID=1961848 RepID=UPI0018E9E509|nr:ABC transporter permease [Kineosporia sp. R_H_3]
MPDTAVLAVTPRTTHAPAGPRSAATATTQVVVLTARCARLAVRHVDGLVTALVLPVVILAVFVWLFGGAVRADGRYVDDVVPGIVAICAGFGAGTTAVSVCQDLVGGTVDRLRTLDVGGPALLAAHVGVAVARNLVSSVLVVVVALALGFRPHAGAAGWFVAALVVTAYLTAITWVAACLGMLARSAEGAGGATMGLMFFAYPSSAVVPVDTLPAWLQGFAGHQPVTPVVDGLRALLHGTPPSEVAGTVGTAFAWCAAIVAVAVLAAAVLFRRRTA